MPVEKVSIAADSADELSAALKKYSELESKDSAFTIYVLMTGASDQKTGQSWCPDCVKADPVIEKALQSKIGKDRNAVLVKCPVERSVYKNNPDHPFRKHPQFKLKAVPTLFRYRKGKVDRSLVESQLFNQTLVEALLEQ